MKKKVVVTKCRCERCGAEWIPRTDSPIKCARCGSPYWDRPRKK